MHSLFSTSSASLSKIVSLIPRTPGLIPRIPILFLYTTLLSYRYVTSYGLSDPCDNIEEMLDHVARRLGALLKGIEHI